jgi:PAS domain S-box-containing protein
MSMNFIQLSKDLIWETDCDNVYTYVNARVYKILGYAPEEIIGHPAWEFCFETDSGAFKNCRQRCHSMADTFQRRFRHKNGSEVFVETNCSSIADENGCIIGCLGIDRDITEHKQAVLELESSQARFRALVETSTDIIWEIDKECRYAYISPKFCEILGYAPQSFIGKTLFSHMPKNEGQKIAAIMHSVFGAGQPFQCLETLNLDKDGKLVLLETSGIPFFDVNGHLRGYRGISRDITARKRSENALRQSEVTLRSVLRAAPIGIGVVTDRVFNWVNEQISEMVQYSEDELVGRSARMLYPSDEVYAFVGKEKYGQIKSTGTGTVETQWVKKDGTLIDVLISSTPLDVADLSKGVTFTALDITGRKQVVRELENARALLHASIEQSSSGIIIADAPDVNICLVNSAALAILGIAVEENRDLSSTARMINWNTFWSNAISCSDVDFPLFKAIRDGVFTLNEEVCIRVNSEQKRWVLVNAAPVFNTDGEIIAGTLIFTDITDLKYSEAELKQLKNNLEDEVSKKTQELVDAHERLIKTERLAAMGQLAGTVAHEFRNQLGVMRNVVYLLKIRYKQADEKTCKHLQILEEQIVTTDRIIENILTFARFKKPDFENVNISELLSIVINKIRLRHSMLSMDIVIETEMDPEAENIEADRIQMIQSFDNLINNALDAVDPGGHILISSRKDLDRIVFTVSDDGCGMPQDIQEKVFDPLFTTKARGAGLGLSTVKIMIEAHGGDISIFSESSRGTEITFSLPIKQTA